MRQSPPLLRLRHRLLEFQDRCDGRRSGAEGGLAHDRSTRIVCGRGEHSSDSDSGCAAAAADTRAD
eukprot:364783-Chlamydomonas_euryale.AAC.10